MLKIRKILFPTDFSPCSAKAFSHALSLAKRHAASIDLLHVTVLHAEDHGLPPSWTTAPEAPTREDLEKALADSPLGPVLESGSEVPHEVFHSRGVSATDRILEHAADHDVDLVVMGTHGRRGAARLVLGSVTAEVIRRAEVPVLTVRETESPDGSHDISRILVAVDFSEHAKAALVHGLELARANGARLELAHVLQMPVYPYFYAPVPGPPPIEQIEGLRERCQRAFARLIEETGAADVAAEPTLLEGHPSDAVVRHAETSESDLIVVGSHGLTGLKRLLIGSTSEAIVQHATVPVLLVKSFGKMLIADS